jgi:transposase
MSKRTKQDYTTEFRNRAVSMVISSEKTTAQIAKELGMNVTTLYSWINKEKSSNSTQDQPSNAQLFDELKRVKKELAEVKEQRDILKKATAYFAKESR